jgi:hypothetical protein
MLLLLQSVPFQHAKQNTARYPLTWDVKEDDDDSLLVAWLLFMRQPIEK